MRMGIEVYIWFISIRMKGLSDIVGYKLNYKFAQNSNTHGQLPLKLWEQFCDRVSNLGNEVPSGSIFLHLSHQHLPMKKIPR